MCLKDGKCLEFLNKKEHNIIKYIFICFAICNNIVNKTTGIDHKVNKAREEKWLRWALFYWESHLLIFTKYQVLCKDFMYLQ